MGETAWRAPFSGNGRRTSPLPGVLPGMLEPEPRSFPVSGIRGRREVTKHDAVVILRRDDLFGKTETPEANNCEAPQPFQRS